MVDGINTVTVQHKAQFWKTGETLAAGELGSDELHTLADMVAQAVARLHPSVIVVGVRLAVEVSRPIAHPAPTEVPPD